MKKFKKIAAAAASLAVMTATTMSLSGSAVTTVRDPDGDGRILLSDGSFILQYLAGNFNPTSQRSLDFDGNGIISNKDATMLQHYWMQLMDGGNIIDESQLPAPVGADSQAVATTRSYVRHYYNNSASNPVTQYTLTVDPRDNTASTKNSVSPFSVPDISELEPHNETAIVKLDNAEEPSSGFIIDDHVIVTAAHCVFDFKTGTFVNNNIILTDSNGNSRVVYAKYTDLNSEYYYFDPSDYYEPSDDYDPSDDLVIGQHHDYALLYVEEDLSDYGFLRMGVTLDQYINNGGEVYASGYPVQSECDYQGETEITRFKTKGYANTSWPGYPFISHSATLRSGQSGGPTFVEEEFTTDSGTTYYYQTVIAINSRGHNRTNFSYKITPDLLKFYYDNPYIDY